MFALIGREELQRRKEKIYNWRKMERSFKPCGSFRRNHSDEGRFGERNKMSTVKN